MRLLTLLYGAVLALMVLFFVLSVFGVFTDVYVDPGM